MPISSDQDMLDFQQLLNQFGNQNSTPAIPQLPPLNGVTTATIQRPPQSSPVAPQLTGASLGGSLGMQVGNDPSVLPSAGNGNGDGSDDTSDVVKQAIAQKYGFSPQANEQALVQAQHKANSQKLINNLGSAVNSAIGGISQRPIDNTLFKSLNEQADQGVQDVTQRQGLEAKNQALAKQQELEDPSSAQSKALQNTIQRLYPDKFSNEDLSKISAGDAGIILKPLELQQTIEMRRDIANTNAATRAGQAQVRTTQQQDKTLQSAQQLLESARGNPAAAQAEKDLYSAQKANSLATLYSDPNKLSMPQVNLLASEIAKIASGGAPTMEELKGITPNTLMGKLSTVTSNLTNQPSPANAAAFVKQYQDYTSALAKDAQKVIQDKYGRVIETRKAQLGPDNYDSLKAQYLDRFQAPGQSPSPASSPDSRVNVISPDGKIGHIPASQLQDALSQGYKQQ